MAFFNQILKAKLKNIIIFTALSVQTHGHCCTNTYIYCIVCLNTWSGIMLEFLIPSVGFGLKYHLGIYFTSVYTLLLHPNNLCVIQAEVSPPLRDISNQPSIIKLHILIQHVKSQMAP